MTDSQEKYYFSKKSSLERDKDMLNIIYQLDSGWSFNMALKNVSVSYQYGYFLRKKYPEFDLYVSSILKKRKIRGFA